MAPPEDSQNEYRFGRWSEALGELYLAWSRTNVQFASAPSIGSPAIRDDEVLALLAAGELRRDGTGTGLDAVQMIDAAAQHILALRSLADCQTPNLAPFPVVRAVTEHVAHAVWLLEPGIGAEARMARRWMARLAGAHRYRWMASARRATAAEQREARRVRTKIRDELLLRFPNADIAWNDPSAAPLPPWNIAGETYPTFSRQCSLLEGQGLGRLHGVYDTLSFLTHPNPVALTMQSDRLDNGTFTRVTYRANPGQWTSAINLASVLFYVACVAACEYFLVGSPHMDAWRDSYMH